jgi:hypothetical protein
MPRPLAENGLRLSVHRAAKACLSPGGPILWQWTCNDEVTASIRARALLDSPSSGWLELLYRVEGVSKAQRVAIRGVPCRYGGQRWYAVRAGRLSSVIYSFGEGGFHPARAYGRIAYASQRSGKPWDRALRRRDHILTKRLKSNDPFFAPKPKWMRWRTYRRLLSEMRAMDAICDTRSDELLRRIHGLVGLP